MSETIAQTQQRITAFIRANAPSLDVSPGSVFNELVVNTEAKIQNAVYADVNEVSAGKSVGAALASPTDTYNAVIDEIASNYGVTRQPGTAVTGVIAISVSSGSNAITVSAGTTFVQPNLSFSYSVVTTTTASTSDGSLMKGMTGGSPYYYFYVPVQATQTGTDKTVSNGITFQLAVGAPAIAGLISAVAYGTFTQGKNTETDKQLIARFRAGQSVVNCASTDAIAKQLANTFPSFQSIYLASQIDPLNLRASNNPFGLKLPGYVDIYLRNSVAIPQTTISTATFGGTVSYNSSSHVWTIGIPAAAAPGFYRVFSVVDQANPTTHLPYTITYGVTSDPANLVQTAEEARYSIYQTATLSVTYATGGSPTFLINVLAPNQLVDAQTLISAPATRLPNADYLVKGVVPCEVSVYVTLVPTPGTVLDTVAIRSDIFNYINGLGVGQPVAVSRIINICHNYSVSQVKLPIILKGLIRAPYQNVTGNVTDFDIPLNGTDSLVIPNLPQYGVTQSNTAFFTNYFGDTAQENISISVVNS